MSEHVNKRTAMSIRASGRLSDLLIGLILGIAGFITFVPVILLIEFAFKSRQQMADARWLPTLPLHLENFGRAWEVMAPGLLNSVIYVIGSVSIGLTCCTLTAYVFARYKFPGRKFLYRDKCLFHIRRAFLEDKREVDVSGLFKRQTEDLIIRFGSGLGK